jgi:S-adenosylmethionine:tRNA ribosyltransferase-isomerase
MKTSDFAYELPEELIAQEPLAERDRSRLLVLDRSAGFTRHQRFACLPELLRPGDRLVFNDTKVIPARLHCRKSSGGAVEVLFTRRLDSSRWEALVRPGRRVHTGTALHPEGYESCTLHVTEHLPDGGRVIAFEGASGSLDDLIETLGAPPLPPYIRRAADNTDRDRYQTVYARRMGAVAAPTAGLHFTQGLLDSLAHAGIQRSFVTLHVGIGTFRPVKEDDPRQHRIHREWYDLSPATAEQIAATKKTGGRVIAVGTTAVRVLEFCAREDGTPAPSNGQCDLYILPGYRFRIVDAMITNFHLPCSTLLMLVAAFAGRERVLEAYREAVAQRYRFYSYGDAMLIG